MRIGPAAIVCASLVLLSAGASAQQLSCFSPSFYGVCIVGNGEGGFGGQWHTHITTTDFGTPLCGDKVGHMASGISTDALPFYAALPTPRALRRTIEVRNPSNGRTLSLKVLDVGPWNVNDDQYVFNANVRPQAESGYAVAGPNAGRKTNKAGLDLSCQAAAALGMSGTSIMDWRFTN